MDTTCIYIADSTLLNPTCNPRVNDHVECSFTCDQISTNIPRKWVTWLPRGFKMILPAGYNMFEFREHLIENVTSLQYN